MERWKPIRGYEGIYEVSSHGRVKSVARIDCNGRPIRERIKRISVNNYPKTALNLNGGSKTYRIHRLVLEAFVGPRPEGMECRHLNGDKFDNRLENLVWGTPEENTEDTVKHGSRWVGERVYNAKITEQDVREIRASDAPLKELVSRYGVSMAQASRVRNGSRWTHVQG